MIQKKVVDIDGTKHPLHIYLERRNSVRVSITKRGINLRIPRHLSKHERETQAKKMIHWAVNKLKTAPPVRELKKKYQHGDYIKTHAKIYRLDITLRDSKKNFCKLNGNIITFKLSQKNSPTKRQAYMSKQLKKILAKAHQASLEHRTHYLNKQHFGLTVNKVSWKYTKSRWGVCKIEQKQIELSTKLLLAPVEILDYVIIHELAHLIEANHSKRYWNIVRSIDPHYKDKITWLKQHGKELVL